MKIPHKLNLNFPKKFFWGVSTSAHQVEGSNHNQWTVWELETARALSNQALYKIGHLAIWDQVKPEAEDPNNYISGLATDHYHRYEADFDLTKKLQFNAFRFSIEWSRIEPEEGVWSAEAIQHYRDYLRALKARSIEPFVTLFHFTLPEWFASKGGFEKRRNVKYFVRFATKIFQELGREFKYVITINEPEVYVSESYYHANWPPMSHKTWTLLRVNYNLAYAHRKVYRAAKRSGRKFLVSLAKNSAYNYAGDDALLSRATAVFWRYAHDYFFLNRVRRQLDWLGINYYFSNRYYGYRMHNPDEHLSDVGWEMRPDDIQFVVEKLYARYKKPIIITENGVADQHDQFRQWWIMHTLVALGKAVQNGARVEGYLHWSLLDNFEWAYGKWPRFGLVAVDYNTLERTPRKSALWFARVIKQLRES